MSGTLTTISNASPFVDVPRPAPAHDKVNVNEVMPVPVSNIEPQAVEVASPDKHSPPFPVTPLAARWKEFDDT